MELRRFPNRLKRYRRYYAFSQKKVARLVGLKDTSAVSRWEKGVLYPSVTQLFRLCRVYNVMPHDLYSDLWSRVSQEFAAAEEDLLAQEESFINKLLMR